MLIIMQLRVENKQQMYISVEENVTKDVKEKIRSPYWNMTTEERQKVS